MKQDQRRHPRVAHTIRVRSHSREAVEFETIDLSVGGFRCTAPAFLPPMTRLAVSLALPEPGGHSGPVVRGEAVVVRIEPSAPAGDRPYRMALFFSRMEDGDRRILADFLSKHVGENGH